MNLTIGGTPATEAQLDNLRTALGVPSKQSLADSLGLGDKAAVFLKNGQFVDRTGAVLADAPDFSPIVSNGVAKVQIGADFYALLLLDANGDFVANVGHRRGYYADLMALDGVPGEVSIPYDKQGFVLHNGIAGQAEFWPRLDANTINLGEASITLGINASTTVDALGAVALGPSAEAQTPGEIVFGGATQDVYRTHLKLFCTTTDNAATIMTVDGTYELPMSVIRLPNRVGIYEATLTLFAREGTTGNCARFVRNWTWMVGTSKSTITTLVTETPRADYIHANLSGVGMSFLGTMGGRMIIVQVTGLTGKTLTWGGTLDIRGMFTGV